MSNREEIRLSTIAAWSKMDSVGGDYGPVSKKLISRRRLRLVQSLVLGLGAPAGWFWLKGKQEKRGAGQTSELFGYMLLGSAAVIGGFGYLLGKREDELVRLNSRL